jgi:hypothetical protein
MSLRAGVIDRATERIQDATILMSVLSLLELTIQSLRVLADEVLDIANTDETQALGERTPDARYRLESLPCLLL